MSSDAYSDDTLQYNSRLLQHGLTNSIHATSYDKIEMNIGHWYLDEFGNRTREITARDAQSRSPSASATRTAQPDPANTNGGGAFSSVSRDLG